MRRWRSAVPILAELTKLYCACQAGDRGFNGKCMGCAARELLGVPYVGPNSTPEEHAEYKRAVEAVLSEG